MILRQTAYNVDPIRQSIAESWPKSMDDAAVHAICLSLRYHDTLAGAEGLGLEARVRH